MIPIESVFDRISSVLEDHPQIELPSQSQITGILNQKVTGALQTKDTVQLVENSQQSQEPEHQVSNGTRDTSGKADGQVILTDPIQSAIDDLEITTEPPSPLPNQNLKLIESSQRNQNFPDYELP